MDSEVPEIPNDFAMYFDHLMSTKDIELAKPSWMDFLQRFQNLTTEINELEKALNINPDTEPGSSPNQYDKFGRGKMRIERESILALRKLEKDIILEEMKVLLEDPNIDGDVDRYLKKEITRVNLDNRVLKTENEQLENKNKQLENKTKQLENENEQLKKMKPENEMINEEETNMKHRRLNEQQMFEHYLELIDMNGRMWNQLNELTSSRHMMSDQLRELEAENIKKLEKNLNEIKERTKMGLNGIEIPMRETFQVSSKIEDLERENRRLKEIYEIETNLRYENAKNKAKILLKKTLDALHETWDELVETNPNMRCNSGTIEGWNPCLYVDNVRWKKVLNDLKSKIGRISQCKLMDEILVREFDKLRQTLNISTMNEKNGQQKMAFVDLEVERCRELLWRILEDNIGRYMQKQIFCGKYWKTHVETNSQEKNAPKLLEDIYSYAEPGPSSRQNDEYEEREIKEEQQKTLSLYELEENVILAVMKTYFGDLISDELKEDVCKLREVMKRARLDNDEMLKNGNEQLENNISEKRISTEKCTETSDEKTIETGNGESTSSEQGSSRRTPPAH